MKYVIDCTPEQLDYIKNVCPGVATMGIASAIDFARPLSELCEEEAKKTQDIADKIKRAHCKETSCCEESWDSLDRANEFDNYEAIASAFRSFGSKQ